MVFHMLAVFDKETARAPAGIESLEASLLNRKLFPDDAEMQQSEEYCKQTLERAYSASKPAARHLEMLGHGNGFTFEASPYCSYASRNGVHVLFAGEVSEWPGIDAVSLAHNAFVKNEPPPELNDAHWLLDFYASFLDFSPSEVADTVLRRLTQVRGSFSFVIYDEKQRRVLAARDMEGSQPLYWGATDDGHMMFGSCEADLEACNPSATPFPAGSMFSSERAMKAYSPGDQGWVIGGDDLPGRLFSFMTTAPDTPHWRAIRAIPRLTAQGVVCGAVYKVASMSDLAPQVSTH